MSLVFRDKDAPFLWVQGGHLSQEGIMTRFRGRSEGPSAHAVSQIPSVEHVQYAKVLYFGGCVLNPISMLSLKNFTLVPGLELPTWQPL